MRSKKRLLLCVLAGVCFLLGAYMLTVFTAVRFCGMLFCCAGAVFIIFAVLDKFKKAGKNWAHCTQKILCVLLAAGFILFAAMEVWVLQWARTDNETDVAAVVVFGAGVNGTVPSLSLKVRLEAALAYIADKPDIPIVVSGGQGPGEDITEARCMADWLIERGVDSDRILLEEKATNTEENVRFSGELLYEHGVITIERRDVVSGDYGITDVNGNTVAWASSGGMGFKGCRKNTPYAAQTAAEAAAKGAMEHGMKTVEVYVKGPGNGREAAILALQTTGLNITLIKDVTPIPHNGCRPPKRRRV